MHVWQRRSLMAFELLLVAGLAWLAAYRVPQAAVVRGADTMLVTALLLLFACVGLTLKLRRGWSTRILWEWMFVGTVFFGGWIYPRLLLPGFWGAVLGFGCTCLLFFWCNRPEIRIMGFWIGTAGAGVLFASSLGEIPLGLLWLGLALHDQFAAQSMGVLESFLTDLSSRRGIPTEFVSMTGLKARIWASHMVIPSALVTRVTWKGPVEGAFLCLALLIGAWYAIMRTNEGKPVWIVPWAAIWMVGAILLMRFIIPLLQGIGSV